MEMGRCQEYIDALEEERKKIQVFQRELPLCLQLVTQAIEACRQQLEAEIGGAGSDCEETSSEGPVLEEFIPLKKDSEDTQKENCREETKEDGCGDTSEKDEKPDWLRSVQLWSQDAESTPKEDVDSYRKSLSSETKKRGAFHPFCKEKKAPSDPSPAPSAVAAPAATVAASSATTKGEDKEGSAQKKTRRCWSPELHHRFLHALQQLGGSHAATPKQIRELMKVDGLTNDEVKSHLQVSLSFSLSRKFQAGSWLTDRHDLLETVLVKARYNLKIGDRKRSVVNRLRFLMMCLYLSETE